MKRLVLCLLLLGCSNADDKVVDLPAEEALPKANKITFYRPEPVYKLCDVSRVDEVRDCTIYTLTCEDDSTEYYLTCSNQPMGYVTNPPRPVEPVWESTTKQE